jgi:cell division septation protein DedD
VPDILLKNKLRGEVIAVDRIGDTASNTFGVKLSMPNPENRIPAGLKCIAKFIEMTPEQIAAQADITASEDTPDPQLAESVPTEATDKESPGLLSSIIGNANAATTPAKTVVDSDYSMNKDMKQSINRMQVQSGEKEEESFKKTPTSYMVTIKTPETRAATEDLVDKLHVAGVNDFFVYRKTGRISLGVFKTRGAAEKRRREIASLGFVTRTLERYK